MKTHVQPPAVYIFDFPRLDTAVEVTSSVEGVVIRASRHSASEERKLCFVRALAAEGFIDEACCWRPLDSLGGVHWLAEAGGFMFDAACVARTRRLTLRLCFSAAALWLCLMGSLLLHARR